MDKIKEKKNCIMIYDFFLIDWIKKKVVFYFKRCFCYDVCIMKYKKVL